MEFNYRHLTKEPLQLDELAELAKGVGGDIKSLINPKSKKLSTLGVDLASLSQEEAGKLATANPQVLYRPIIAKDSSLVLGFKEADFAQLIK